MRSNKIAARGAVATAIRTGALVPQPCRDCGRSPAQAHHPDYAKPLEVVWLCRVHHRVEERLNPSVGANATTPTPLVSELMKFVDEKKLTIGQVASMSGVHRTVLYKWFHCGATPIFETFCTVATAVGASVVFVPDE